METKHERELRSVALLKTERMTELILSTTGVLLDEVAMNLLYLKEITELTERN